MNRNKPFHFTPGRRTRRHGNFQGGAGRLQKARRKLEGSIEDGEEYCYVYEKSVELDRLIEIYIAMGY